jgi:outer membrane lipoprotein-sorting protein
MNFSLCRRLLTAGAVSLGLVGASVGQVQAQSARPVVNIAGPLITVQSNMTSFFAIALDPGTGRAFVSHPDDNKITIYEPTGIATGTVISGITKPTDLLAVDGAVFALVEGGGQIIRIDPVTQQFSVVVSGIPTPRGLGFTTGKLWTVKQTGSGWPDRKLISIDPTTGAQQEFSFTANGSAPEFERMTTSQMHPGVLFGSYGPGISPSGLNRLVIGTGEFQHLHDSVGPIKILGDGSLLGYRTENSSVGSFSPVNVQLGDRRWRPAGGTSAGPVAYDGGTRSVTVANGNVVTMFDSANTASWYRRFTFGATHTIQANGVLVAPNDSRIIVVTQNSAISLPGKVTVSTLAGVGGQSASQATGDMGNSVRLPSSPAFAASTASRAGATPVFPPTLRMNSFTDAVAEPTTGRVFVASGADDLIDVFGPNGMDVGSIASLGNPTHLAVLNGFVYALLANQGSVVRIDPVSLTATTVVTGLVKPTSLSAVAGSLWTIEQHVWPQARLVKVDPVSKTDTRYLLNSFFEGYTKLFRNGIGGDLYGSAFGGPYELNRLQSAPSPSVTASSAFTSAPVSAVVPSRATVLDNGSSGLVHQYDATTMVDSGVTYPGLWPAVSNTPSTLVVTRNGNTLTSYSYGPSAQQLRFATVNNTFTVVAHDFMPSSTTVWAILRNNTSGFHFFSIIFDAQPPALAPVSFDGEFVTAEQIPAVDFGPTQPSTSVVAVSETQPKVASFPEQSTPRISGSTRTATENEVGRAAGSSTNLSAQEPEMSFEPIAPSGSVTSGSVSASPTIQGDSAVLDDASENPLSQPDTSPQISSPAKAVQAPISTAPASTDITSAAVKTPLPASRITSKPPKKSARTKPQPARKRTPSKPFGSKLVK